MNAVKRLCRWLEALNIKHVVVLLFAIGFVVHFGALVVLRIHMTIAFAEMEKIARSLAENGTFANPFRIPTGATGHHAPIYPFLLSLIFRAFGYATAAAYAVAAMNICFAALQCALIPVLTDVAKIHRVVGVTTGLFGALVPFRIVRETRWETTLSALALVVLVILTTRWWQTAQPSRFRTFLLGLAWGAGMLNCPVLLPVFMLLLVLFVASAWMRKQRQWLLTAALAFVGMILAVSPWTIRNYRELGGFVFVRSNFGIELSISFNPQAHALFADNLSIGYPNNYYHLHHPWASEKSAEKVRQIGELAYNRQCFRQGITWIREDPRRFVKLVLQRAVFYWFMSMESQWLKALLLIPWTLLAAAGIWRALRRHVVLAYIVLCIWIGYPLPYYLLQADARYRYPLDWTFALFAFNVLTKPLWDTPGPERRGRGWSSALLGMHPLSGSKPGPL